MEIRQFKYEILKEIGIISVNKKTGWTKELNIISWNDMKAKLDIREWGEKRYEMGRGITLTLEELDAILEHFINQEKSIRHIIEPNIYLSDAQNLER